MADPAAARGEAGQQYAGPEIDDCPSGSGLHPAPEKDRRAPRTSPSTRPSQRDRSAA